MATPPSLRQLHEICVELQRIFTDMEARATFTHSDLNALSNLLHLSVPICIKLPKVDVTVNLITDDALHLTSVLVTIAADGCVNSGIGMDTQSRMAVTLERLRMHIQNLREVAALPEDIVATYLDKVTRDCK